MGENMPKWESDFWADLLAGSRVKVAEEVWRSEDYVSPYDNGNVLVGEIVEDTPSLTA